MKVASSPPFIPENPSACKVIQGLFMNDKYADIVFEIGGKEQPKNNEMKIAKTAPVTFPAHRNIVASCSSILADLCQLHKGKTPIEITGVSLYVFRLLLSYIYGIKVLDDDMRSHAREIIDAADKFGVIGLKLEAEASLVEYTIFTMENVMELILYADSKCCALLKEAAVAYLVENKAVGLCV